MNGLLKSRKFWVLVLDTVIALVSYFVTKYAAPSMTDDVLIFIGVLQPVFLMMINAIAKEDAAAKAAGTFRY